VFVTWELSSENGSPITSYSIFVKENGSDTYTQESVDCDGTSASVIANRGCFIYLSTLIVEPYNLVKDESVLVKVVASNLYGDSD
jgi:hypothetical protein